MRWEDWTDRLIREGMERGDFSGLAGAGKPIEGLDGRRDELWWVRRKLRDEELDALPPSLAVIRHLNRYGAAGPPSTLMALDVDSIVDRWRQARAG